MKDFLAFLSFDYEVFSSFSFFYEVFFSSMKHLDKLIIFHRLIIHISMFYLCA